MRGSLAGRCRQLRLTGWKVSLLLCLVILGGIVGCSDSSNEEWAANKEHFQESAAVERETEKETEKNGETNSGQEVVEESSETWGMAGVVAEMKERRAAMSLEEKAGQVIMPAFRQTASGEPLRQMDEHTRELLSEVQPAGLILFSENIAHEAQVKQLIEAFQATARLPLLMAVDEEGGRVSRLSVGGMTIPRLPAAEVLGKSEDEKVVYEAGYQLGEAMKSLGFNMNMAPVADVNTNPRNPVIGDRSFGSDPEAVGQMAVAMANGLMDAGVLPVLKHFPGHGDTHQDTHKGAVSLPHDRERLESVELVPFRQGVEAGLPVIMTAHLHVTAYDQDFPATLSPILLTQLLRETLAFEGVIITDALDMQAITDQWTTGEAAVMALAAGADLLLMPPEPQVARDAIVTAVTMGELPQERLDAAVERVLLLKWKAGLIN